MRQSKDRVDSFEDEGRSGGRVEREPGREWTAGKEEAGEQIVRNCSRISEARGSERTKKRYPELIRTANKPQNHQYSVPDSSKPMNLVPHNARLQLI